MKRFALIGCAVSMLVVGCETGKTPPTVSQQGGSAWEAAIESKKWNALPNPLTPYEAGDVLFVINDNGAMTTTKVNACQGMLDPLGYTEGKEAWGNLVQNQAFEAGIFVDLEEGVLPQDANAELKAGSRTVRSYTANFGEVSTKKVNAASFEISAYVSEECSRALSMANSQGLLDSIYIVAGSVRADTIDYTFNLNPSVQVDQIIKDSEVPDPNSPDVRQYEEKCGTYAKADGKLLKFFGLAINGSNCVSGTSSIKTSQPYYIAHITYPASALQRSGATSGDVVIDPDSSVSTLQAVDAETVDAFLRQN